VKIRTRTENQVFNPILGEIRSPDIRLWDRRCMLTIPFLNDLSRNFGGETILGQVFY